MSEEEKPPPDYDSFIAEKMEFWLKIDESGMSSPSSSSTSSDNNDTDTPPPSTNPDYKPELDLHAADNGYIPFAEAVPIPPSESFSNPSTETFSIPSTEIFASVLSEGFSINLSTENVSPSSPPDSSIPRARAQKRKRSPSLRGAARKTKKLAKSTSFKLKKFDEKHHVVDKTKKMARTSSQKLKEAAAGTKDAVKEFDEKHHFAAKTRHQWKKAASFVRRKS